MDSDAGITISWSFSAIVKLFEKVLRCGPRILDLLGYPKTFWISRAKPIGFGLEQLSRQNWPRIVRESFYDELCHMILVPFSGPSSIIKKLFDDWEGSRWRLAWRGNPNAVPLNWPFPTPTGASIMAKPWWGFWVGEEPLGDGGPWSPSLGVTSFHLDDRRTIIRCASH